jgi:predicted MFS family arabinose efflux permease
MLVSSKWIALFIVLLISVFSALRYTSSISLTLEQDPALRGTMMSLNTAALSLGRVIGAAVGGFSLLFIGWAGVGVSMSVLGLVAVLFYSFIAVDPVASEH